MVQNRIIPCLLLKDNFFVKTIQFENPKHISEPIYAIKIFNDYEADELIILDIMASRTENTTNKASSKIPFDLISQISDESCMPIAYGGGISTITDIQKLFRAGIEKVCINSNAHNNEDFIRKASQEFGSQSIIVGIDVKTDKFNYNRVYSHCGYHPLVKNAREYAIESEAMGAGEILIQSINRDGTMTGYDIPLIKTIAESVHVPVIALGGAGSYNDLSKAIHEGKAAAASAGSMFVFYGKKRAVLITYPSSDEIRQILL